MQSIFVYIYTRPWYILVCLIPLISVLYAIVKNRLKEKGRKGTVLWVLLLIVWTIAILLATLQRQSGELISEGFQPLFHSYEEARLNSELYRSNFLNVLLFFPGGLFLCSLIPERCPNVIRIIVPTFLLGMMSFAIENVQLYYNLGLPEMDDIMHNTIGALLGACVATVIKTASPKITTKKLKHDKYDD